MAAGSNKPDPNNLIWIDMEMTGLVPDADRIIEIALLVTDSQLNLVAEGPVLVVKQPDEVLAAIRTQVAREWENERRTISLDENYRKLREKYEVVIDVKAPSGATKP